MLTIVLWLLSVVLFLFLLFMLHLREWPSARTSRLFALLPRANAPWCGFELKMAFSKMEDRLEVCTAVTKERGIAGASILGTFYLFISDPDILEDVLSSRVHITKGKVYDSATKWLNTGLLTSTGDKWHHRRKLLTPAFHFKILEDNMTTFNVQSKVLVSRLLTARGEPVDIHKYITACTLDIIGEAAMGIKLEAQKNKSLEYSRNIAEVCWTMGYKESTFYYLKDWTFNMASIGRKFNKQVKQLHAFTEQVINTRKGQREREQRSLLAEQNKEDTRDEEGMSGQKRKAFLDLLLDHEATHEGTFSFLDLREEVDTFMFEGHDTVSSAIMYTLYMLGKYKDIQERAVAEVDEVFGGEDRELTMKDLPRLSYLETVIKETLRLFPSVPMIGRKLTSDLQLKNGMLVPEGTNIMVVTNAVHHEEKHWPQPDKFDPDRFKEENIRGRHPYSYIPFSAGPRNCIGQKFAMMELKVVVATILRHFTVDSLEANLKPVPAVVLKSVDTLYACFTPR